MTTTVDFATMVEGGIPPIPTPAVAPGGIGYGGAPVQFGSPVELYGSASRGQGGDQIIGSIPTGSEFTSVQANWTPNDNAGTTADVDLILVDSQDATNVHTIHTFDVTANPPAIVPLGAGHDVATLLGNNHDGVLVLKYRETGTASTTGGPFSVWVKYAPPSSGGTTPGGTITAILLELDQRIEGFGESVADRLSGKATGA